MTKFESECEGGWENVQDNCMLCEMEKKTEWHLQTKDWLIAEKLGGGPFIVYKEHKKELDDDEINDMHRVVRKMFDDYHIRVRMNLVEDHFHAHIVTDEDIDLSNE